MSETVKVYQHGTWKQIATVKNNDFNAWCEVNGWLPHHACADGWVVIK